MFTKTVCFFLLLIFNVNCKNVKHRNPRFIGGTFTSTITSTHIVTSLVPSSCVYVDPTLQPCRSVRFLNFPQFDSIGKFFNNTSPFRARSDKTETTPLGWGEYFGIYQPTVTVTQIELQTATVQDPRVAVTYAVKGCRPLKLPKDLDSCEIDSPATLSILEILPTSTVVAPFSSTLVPSTAIHEEPVLKRKVTTPLPMSNKTNQNDIKVVPSLEGSTTEEYSGGQGSSQQPTEPLKLEN